MAPLTVFLTKKYQSVVRQCKLFFYLYLNINIFKYFRKIDIKNNVLHNTIHVHDDHILDLRQPAEKVYILNLTNSFFFSFKKLPEQRQHSAQSQREPLKFDYLFKNQTITLQPPPLRKGQESTDFPDFLFVEKCFPCIGQTTVL